jgi:type II secretory pathway pseudopilin PulG
MRFPRINSRNAKAFTLAEVLAALVFMAILIPVAVMAVRTASQAGQVGERKAAAALIADRVLSELLINGTLLENSSQGRVSEGNRTYDWTMRAESWDQGSMKIVTLQVVYSVQGKDYNVSLSTLFDSSSAVISP